MTQQDNQIIIENIILSSVKNNKKQKEGDKELLPVFDESQFPLITVSFSTTLDRPAFIHFFEKWLECYRKDKDFTFIFNLTTIKWVSPSYVLLIIKFMKNLRKYQSQLPYLKTSIIVLNNNLLKGLLYKVFKVQPPMSHIYLVSSIEHAIKIYQNDEVAKAVSVNIPPNTLLQ